MINVEVGIAEPLGRLKLDDGGFSIDTAFEDVVNLNVDLILKVSLDEPTNKLEYDSIANKQINCTLTFSAIG